jgi:hypothetical protein
MSTTGERTTSVVSKRSRTEYRRIPCRARSLSHRHNCDTAYFQIPWNAPHGLQVQCSQEECIQSGRRFRYCKGKHQDLNHKQKENVDSLYKTF